MKKVLILVLSLISLNCFSQIKEEPTKIIDLISKIINKNVTFVSWYIENDTIKITQFTTYDNIIKRYENFYIEYIKKYYPILLNLPATKLEKILKMTPHKYFGSFEDEGLMENMVD